MRKKVLTAALAAIAVFMVFCNRTALGETARRKLTLMIYMCGSNLESGYGAASEDIEEMKAAGLKGKDVTVLLMTGGTEQWSQGYDATKCLIHELGPRGTRVVWRSDAMNMGEPETLTQLLRFGREAYPAEDYALILWNHGGGPVEGVCWDELFSLDRLTLAELSFAIEKADMGKKLRWVGFDACLMGSLEVANTLAPYAEYMIASEETEPSAGWNYQFLCGLSEDKNGGETGKRIVDCYFENDVMSGETLTLACLDLSCTEKTMEAFDAYFEGAVKWMNEDAYVEMSSVRNMTMDFGKAVRGSEENEYDLADLVDLVERWDLKQGRMSELKTALDKMVLYNRSNREGANGISVYHPFVNKIKYQNQWRESYQCLGFSDPYTAYMDVFTRYLFGEEIIDWSGLKPIYEGIDGDGKHHFSLQLTQKQAACLASAELLVLQDVSWFPDPVISLVGDEETRITPEGKLSAVYNGLVLSIVDDQDGRILASPIRYNLSQKEKYRSVRVVYVKNVAEIDQNYQQVWYCLPADEMRKIPEIIQIKVRDHVTGDATNRIAFSEDGYDLAMIPAKMWYFPESENGVLPGMADWPETVGQLSSWNLDLPLAWHFEYTSVSQGGDPMWAVFQLTDIQQRTWCTEPIRLRQAALSDPVTSDTIQETDDWRISLSAQVDSSLETPSLRLDFHVRNKTDQDAAYRFSNMVLNGRRIVEANNYPIIDVPAGKEYSCVLLVDPQNLVRLSEVNEVAVDLEWKDPETKRYREPVSLRFPFVGYDVSAIASSAVPMAEFENEDVICSLLSLQRTREGIKARFYVENKGEETLYFEDRFVLNDFWQTDGIWRWPDNGVGRGGSQVVERNIDFMTSFMEITPSLMKYHISDGLDQFADSISTISVSMENSEQQIRLQLDRPWAIPAKAADDWDGIIPETELLTADALAANKPLLLCENEQAIAYADWTILRDGVVRLRLTLENKTDRQMALELNGLCVNGVSANLYSSYRSVTIKPHCVLQKLIELKDDIIPAAAVINEISFTLTLDGKPADTPCVIHLEKTEAEEQTYFIVRDGNEAWSEPAAF